MTTLLNDLSAAMQWGWGARRVLERFDRSQFEAAGEVAVSRLAAIADARDGLEALAHAFSSNPSRPPSR